MISKKERDRQYSKEWRKKNKERKKEYNKKYCSLHKEYFKEYYKLNKYKYEYKYNKEYFKEYRKNNREKIREIKRKCEKKIRLTLKGILNNRIAPAIRKALKSTKANRSWEKLVGYTINELKNHIENKFTLGMNWEKLKNGEIHIDHIKPKSLFKYKNPEDEEFKKCWALENLQPLWKIDNLRKGKKYN